MSAVVISNLSFSTVSLAQDIPQADNDSPISTDSDNPDLPSDSDEAETKPPASLESDGTVKTPSTSEEAAPSNRDEGGPSTPLSPTAEPQEVGAPSASGQPSGEGAADAGDDLLAYSLEDLLDMPVQVASGGRSKRSSEAPGIVTVITSRDIERSGARDLIDVLRMVPGFEPEYDISGTVGIGMRGNWASEGKVLILVDGMTLNEPLQGVYNIGHRFPLELIDRIEIIRGPGSAMYGGEAELGVISIHTKKASGKADLQYAAKMGLVLEDRGAALGRLGGSVFGGGKFEHVQWGLAAAGEFGRFTTRMGEDIYGDAWDAGDDKVSSLHLNGHLQLYGLTVRALVERYEPEYTYSADAVWDEDDSQDVGVSDYASQHYSLLVDARYEGTLSDTFKLTPRIAYRHQRPWVQRNMKYDNGVAWHNWDSNISGEVFTAEFNAAWSRFSFLNLQGGLVYDHYLGRDRLEQGALSGENQANYFNPSFHLTALGETKIVDYAVGARLNYHEQFGFNAVPRLALTRSFLTYFHAKLLAAMAYKAPTMMNLAAMPNIQPERTGTVELELGAKFKEFVFFTTNLFLTEMSDVIVYAWDEAAQTDSYSNQGKVGTWGVEAAGKVVYSMIELDLSYSLYRAYQNTVEDYYTPNAAMTLGFATHKVTAALTFNPIGGLFLTPSLIVLTPRWGVSGTDYYTDSFTFKKYDETLLFDFTLLHKNLLVPGLDLSVSLHNILGDHTPLLEPYASGWEPYHPAAGRELTVRLSWNNF